MTSTTGEAGHPDVDEISALVEDLLSPSLASDIRRHLGECRDCSDTYAALEEVRELLGASPEPLPMPSDIAERIDAALAAEAVRAAEASTPSSETVSPVSVNGAAKGAASVDSSESFDPSSDPDTSKTADSKTADSDGTEHRSGQRSGTRVSRETSPSTPSSPPADRPAGRPRGATGPGRTRRGRFGHRRTITLGAVFTAVVIGLGSVLLQTMTNDDSKRTTATTTPPSEARHAFSSGTLRGQVTTLLKDHPAPRATHSASGTTTPKPSTEMGSPSGAPSPTPSVTKSVSTLEKPEVGGVTIPDCVRNGIGRHEAPIAAEPGTFEGSDAYLVVFPHATDSSKVSAYVVDASCAKGPSAALGKVLLTGSYPRH